MSDFEQTWDTYTQAWKAKTGAQKQEIFAKCLAKDCTYTDPLASTNGWQELTDYMLDFHQQIPDGHFVTTYFLAHHNRSIAKWNMCAADGSIVGEGVSYGQYDGVGKLTAMTGFYETGEAA